VGEARAPFLGGGCGRAGIRVEQQAKRALFEVGEIHAAQFTLGGGEFGRKFADQRDQCGHVVARPFPILRERVIAAFRQQ
jgi:hypothetical protein